MNESKVGYNNADKNRGPVIYSKDLYAEQCRLHLEDDKGTFGKVFDRTNEDIIKEILVSCAVYLSPSRSTRRAGSQFFETYRACVLTLRNAPEWPALRVQLDLSLKGLVESTYGDIFP
jgi:hypothetical protein